MAIADTHKFIELFLQGESLQQTLCYMCNASQGHVVDPITHTLCMMITTPVQVMLTQVGVAPFKDKNTAIFPYRLMDGRQKDFLRSFVKATEKAVKGAMASVQIGGGCVLCKHGQGASIVLNPVDILSAFCRCVADSKTHTNQKIQKCICNIVIQRVGSLVVLDRATLQSVMHHIPGITPVANVDTPGSKKRQTISIASGSADALDHREGLSKVQTRRADKNAVID